MASSTFSTLSTGPFPIKGLSGKVIILLWFTEIPVLNANSVDPDQTPLSAVSDLGLYCLPISLLWAENRYAFRRGKLVLPPVYKWVNSKQTKCSQDS